MYSTVPTSPPQFEPSPDTLQVQYSLLTLQTQFELLRRCYLDILEEDEMEKMRELMEHGEYEMLKKQTSRMGNESKPAAAAELSIPLSDVINMGTPLRERSALLKQPQRSSPQETRKENGITQWNRSTAAEMEESQSQGAFEVTRRNVSMQYSPPPAAISRISSVPQETPPSTSNLDTGSEELASIHREESEEASVSEEWDINPRSDKLVSWNRNRIAAEVERQQFSEGSGFVLHLMQKYVIS